MPVGNNMATAFHYTNERNVQIVISLLKAHGIKRVIASPGTTNMTFVASIQNDAWFQIWSSVDERSAAYMACGMASQTGEPVVLSCTGATASRNYMPGLTEAYYRKLPVLAITSTRGNHKIGQLIDQQVDRRNVPNDIVVESVTIPTVKDAEDEHTCMLEANKAILALSLNGGGPAHINMYTTYSKDLSVKELPPVNAIYRHTAFDEQWPELPNNGRIAIFVGAHQPFTERQVNAIERFCATHDAVVFTERSSGYYGKYAVVFNSVSMQKQYSSPLRHCDLCIHIGEVCSGLWNPTVSHVWRVSPDGELKDTFGKLRRVFMMPEELFFEHYSEEGHNHTEYLDACNQEINEILDKCPELPFGNIWIARHTYDKLPEDCIFHMGILNSLRSWSFVPVPKSIETRCNVGGYGIDGCISAMIGSALANPEKLHIGVFGDLAFFYDMNVLGNRHVGVNVRIMLINNGRGTEFRNYGHICSFLGEEADTLIAAAGHYGNQSPNLVKHYATDLGYEYLSASNKEEYLKAIDRFLTPEPVDNPMLLEVFADMQDESDAMEKILNVKENTCVNNIIGSAKTFIKNALGDELTERLKMRIKG